MKNTVTVPVHLDDKVFRRYAAFDHFRVHRNYISPLIFTLAFTVLAVVSFCAVDRSGSVALGFVMLGMAILLPVMSWFFFRISVNRQIKARSLKDAPLIYTLTLTAHVNGIILHDPAGGPEVRIPWEKVRRVWRRKDCYYLYMTKDKSFLIPVRDLPVPEEEFAAFLQKQLSVRILTRR